MNLPIDQMLRDADSAWNISQADSYGAVTLTASVLGDLACHVRALAAELEKATHERDTLIAGWPSDGSRCVTHRFADGKFIAGESGRAWGTLEAAVRDVVFGPDADPAAQQAEASDTR